MKTKDEWLKKSSELSAELDEAKKQQLSIVDRLRLQHKSILDSECYSDISVLNKRIEKIRNEYSYATMMSKDNVYANRILYSDVCPCEVVERRSDNLFLVREMDAKETQESIMNRLQSFKPGGFIGHFDDSLQKWDIKPNRSKPMFAIRRHKDGGWYDTSGIRYQISMKPVKVFDFNF